MNVLFVHQNFPAQFKHLAPALAQRHVARVLTLNSSAGEAWEGVPVTRYALSRGGTAGIHPWVGDLEAKVIRGEAAYLAAQRLRRDGFVPDVIVAHPGWGESLFLKEVWPQARLGIYCEFFYRAEGADVGFDPEFPVTDPAISCKLLMKNANARLHFDVADAGLSPTRWQADSFPAVFRPRISVIHDGVDTEAVAPNPAGRVILNGELALTRDSEVVTFVARDLEPYRGFHCFMRALPAILRLRPKARVLIVGGSGVSYGAAPPAGESWREVFVREARAQISDTDWSRVHFLGRLSYAHYLAVLQCASVHVYLTYPFVLSWSLLEAMSVGAAVVASDTPPVREVIEDDETGRLVGFFDHQRLAETVAALLDAPGERQRLGANARRHVQENYDLKTVCLPARMRWVEGLVE